MAGSRQISWNDGSWNPMTGCTKLSPGCDNCYAFTIAEDKRGSPAFPVGFDPMLRRHKLRLPAKWPDPRRIFVDSMSDLFHRAWPEDYVFQVLDVMREIDRHAYQVLTKRPRHMRDVVGRWLASRSIERVPHNIWLGVSIENSDFAWRANVLREIPVDVRFISAEPLLGPLPGLNLDGIAWLIVGGESGLGYRPMKEEWARDLRDRALAAGMPFFFRQHAARWQSTSVDLDGRLWMEWPA